MSHFVYFAFSTGLKSTIKVPKGTIGRIRRFVADVESKLGLETTQYLDNPKHWTTESKRCGSIDDATFCREAESHNRWVRSLYDDLAKWTATPASGATVEDLTPEIAAEFWHALEIIDVPAPRWTEEYFVERMEALYQVMRGRETEGISFDAKPLTIKQAEAVIALFGDLIDPGDTRLAVCEGNDHLSRSEDYAWCARCGAIRYDDLDDKLRYCRKRCGDGGCDLRNNYEPTR